MNFKTIISFSIIFAFTSSILVSCNKKPQGEWIAKIDGESISIDELNTFYYAQHKSIYNISSEDIDKLAADPSTVQKNPTLNKQEFLEQLIKQKLIYNKAVKEGLAKVKEVEALIQMAKEAVVVGYYVKEKFKDEIEISDEDVEKIYSKQRDRFKGIPIEQAELIIKQRIFQDKLQKKLRVLVENLREQSKIEKKIDSFLEKDKEDKKS
ncbi:MAG: SurA N-terminal domain-containing protein [Spirochaetota bacterium]|nr:SurA N-terminal domain-containing protein [Spirochaetota bacterium]